MGKAISCKDLGSLECTWEGQADTVEELEALAREHGREAHGMTEFPDELMEQFRAAVRDV